MADAPAAPKLSRADQVLANVLGFLACQRFEDDRTGWALEVLAEVARPAAPGQVHPPPPVARLRAAAAEVLAAAPGRRQSRGGAAWAGAMLAASGAVADFLFWRGELALDALRRTDTRGGTHAAE